MSGLYIHIPFCKQACHYCDFHFSTNLKKKKEMLAALHKELELRKDEFSKVLVQTIYFGGGTPSVLDSMEITELLEIVHSLYRVANDPEITLEANPDDLSDAKIKELAASDVNRLSIGIQSFIDEDLKLMNRIHSSNQAVQCLKTATEHFDNISIDLIYGIPYMTMDRWRQNIEKALSFQIPHISSYALTIEPGTALKKFIDQGSIPEVDDEVMEKQFNILVSILEKEGYEHYEISNFSKPGYYSRNNTAYWQAKKYMGIGPSAHSFNGISRSWNVSNNALYLKSIREDKLPAQQEVLTRVDKFNETVMTGLRTKWGVSLIAIKTEYGQNMLNHLLRQAQKYLQNQLLVKVGDTLLATRKGKFLVDGIAADLFLLNLKEENRDFDSTHTS